MWKGKTGKIALVWLVAVMFAIMLTACGEGGETAGEEPDAGSSDESAAPQQSPAQQEELPGFAAGKDPIELTAHIVDGNFVFNDEWPVFRKAAELTNVSLKGTIPKSVTDSKEFFNLMMASGDLSDIIKSDKENFEKYGVQGAFIPLNDLIAQHAPHIAKFFEERPDVRKIATDANGDIYYIPFTPDGEASTGWFIRQDWLDRLNLQQPKTVDDYYNVLKAFKEGDPNNNGKADEIPYFSRFNTYGVYYLLSLWDAEKEFYIEDGKVVYGPLKPEYRTGMTRLSNWYAEGLIDQEIFTRGGNARDMLLGDNVGGSTHDWFGSTAGYNTSLQDKVPGLQFLPIAPPASVSGTVAEYDFRATVRNIGWGISSQNQYPVETIKYFDFWFSEEGRRLMNFGIEGTTYTMENGQPAFTDKILSSNVVQTLKEEYGAQIEIGFHQDFEYEKQWMDPIARQGVEEYINNGYIVQRLLPILSFTEEEQKRIAELRGPIVTFREETGQKWLLGAESVEAGYDQFVEQLKKMGIDELLDIYNQAYARYLQQ